MELEALAGGDPEGAVGVAIGDLLEREVLAGVERARGERHAHHEGEGLLGVLLAAPAGVAVVLLVGAVELEQGEVVAAEVGDIGRERLRDRAPEMAAFALGVLDFGFVGHVASFAPLG